MRLRRLRIAGTHLINLCIGTGNRREYRYKRSLYKSTSDIQDESPGPEFKLMVLMREPSHPLALQCFLSTPVSAEERELPVAAYGSNL